MAPRPNWKGYLKLALVSCPIALYPAISAGERVSFRQVNKQTGNRLRQQLIDDVTHDPVDSEDKARGYEIAKDSFLLVADEELEAIQVESLRTIEIDKFVPRAQIDVRYFDSPYYVIPTNTVGQEAFAVIREAMRGKETVGLGRVVLSKRERPIILEPFSKGMRGMTLRYPYEVRDERDYFSDIADMKISPEMLKIAEMILDQVAADFDPSKFVDRYEEALIELLKKKQAGIAAKPDEVLPPRSDNATNLMDALRRSLSGSKTNPPIDRRNDRAPRLAAKRATSRPRKTG